MMFIQGEEKVSITDPKHQLTWGMKQLQVAESEIPQDLAANRKANAGNIQKVSEAASAQVESVKADITSLHDELLIAIIDMITHDWSQKNHKQAIQSLISIDKI
jgi:hypothetical protein